MMVFLSHNWHRLACTAAAVLFWSLAAADPAAAVQQHGGAEGLVAHQIGHVLFVAGMLILLVRVHQKRLQECGWGYFKGFLWLIILWNILTFSGHALQEVMPPDSFHRCNGQVLSFTIHNVADFIFYLSRLDHLLLVPAFLALLRALTLWRRVA